MGATRLTPTATKVLNDLYRHPHKMGSLMGYSGLTDIHSRWIWTVYGAQEEHVLMAHRNSFKTSAISIVGAVWALFFWPNESILIVSSTDSNASRIVSEAKRAYDSDPVRDLYQMIGVSEVKDRENWKAQSFTLLTRTAPKKDGSMSATSISGGITGQHYSKVVCDDVVTLKDRYSAAVRKRRHEQTKDLYSVIHPGRAISWVGTPWHPEDHYSTLPAAEKWPVGSTGIPGFTPDYIASLKDRQGYAFYRSQYELEPELAAEGILPEPHFVSDADIPVGGRLMAFLDPAFGGADYVAISLGKIIDGIVYVISGHLWQGTIDQLYDKTVQYCQSAGVETLAVESNQAQKLIPHELKKRGLHVKEIISKDNKHIRIQHYVLHQWDRIRFADSIDDDYLQQLLEYSDTVAHDDAADSLAGLLALLAPAKRRRVQAASRRLI